MSAFGIAEEVVQSIVSALSAVECSMLTKVAAVIYWVVDWTVRRRVLLLGSIVSVVIMLRMAVMGLAGVHLRGMIVIASSISCKMLQVSYHYSFVRRMNGAQPVLLFYIPFPP